MENKETHIGIFSFDFDEIQTKFSKSNYIQKLEDLISREITQEFWYELKTEINDLINEEN